MEAYTNAPADYDYSCVEQVGEVKSPKDGTVWRKLKVLDEKRFRSFQIPRYGSGFKKAILPEEQDELDYYQLPPLQN